MADLSQLSDDQLLAYRDLLKQKQIPPNPSNQIPKASPPVPQGLQGPPIPHMTGDHDFEDMVNNIPRSALDAGENIVRNPWMPLRQPDQQEGEPLGPTPEKLKREVMGAIHPFTHNPADTFIKDPIGSALLLGQMAHGATKGPVAPIVKGAFRGAAKAATSPGSIVRLGHRFDVPNPIAGGIAGEAAGYLMRQKYPMAPEIGAVLGAGAPIAAGAIQGGMDAIPEVKANEAFGPPQNNPFDNRPSRPVNRVEKQPPPDIPVGPTPEPRLPSGRKPGAMPIETQPVEPQTPEATKPPEAETASPNAPNEVTSVEENSRYKTLDKDPSLDTDEGKQSYLQLKTEDPKGLEDWEKKNWPTEPKVDQPKRQPTQAYGPLSMEQPTPPEPPPNPYKRVEREPPMDMTNRRLVSDEKGNPTGYTYGNYYRNPKGIGSIAKDKSVQPPDDTTGQMFKANTAPEDASPDLQQRLKQYKELPPENYEPQAAKTKSGKVVLGADVTSLGNILGSSLYAKNPTGVITKELMQNSHDAIRGVPGGKVTAKLSTHGKWVEISDNGKGMTADDLGTVFTDLGSSGKRNEADASGGFGLAKAAPLMMSEKLELTTVSVDKATGEKYQHVLNTSKADLLGAGSDVTTTWVPKETPTGTTIRAYLGDSFDKYEAQNFIRNTKRSVNPPGPTEGFMDNLWDAPGKMNPLHDFDPPASAKHLMTTEVPGVASVDIYASPPKKYGRGETITPQGSTGIEVNNHGIFQFDYPIYFGGDAKIAGLPDRIAIDIKSLVPEGDRNYPFAANRESLRDVVKNHIGEIIKDKFINPAKDAYIKFLGEKYDSLPTLSGGAPLYDSGNRLTPEEVQFLTTNPDFNLLANIIHTVVGRTIQEVQDSGHMGDLGKSIQRVGIVFAPEIHGVYVPKPGTQEATVFINPLTFKENTTPYQRASLIWHTIKHEILHDQVKGHYEEFTSAEATMAHAIGEYEMSAIHAIKAALHEAPEDSNTLRPGIRKALQLYEESRKREATERDIFGGEQLRNGGSQPGLNGQGQDPSGLSSRQYKPVRK